MVTGAGSMGGIWWCASAKSKLFQGEWSRSVSENTRGNDMATSKARDKQQPKGHIAMKTPPIVPAQEWMAGGNSSS